MNKILSFFLLIGLVAFQACEGPEGPMGPEGEPGIVIVGTTYEEQISFTAANDYMEIIGFDQKLVESDAVLVYRLSAIDNGRDVWRLLPQTYFFDEGAVLSYNFDYTVDDFSIFLDSNFDPAGLPADWRNDQIFRVIVIPSDFPAGRVDYSNYEAVTKMLGITEDDFKSRSNRKY